MHRFPLLPAPYNSTDPGILVALYVTRCHGFELRSATGVQYKPWTRVKRAPPTAVFTAGLDSIRFIHIVFKGRSLCLEAISTGHRGVVASLHFADLWISQSAIMKLLSVPPVSPPYCVPIFVVVYFCLPCSCGPSVFTVCPRACWGLRPS